MAQRGEAMAVQRQEKLERVGKEHLQGVVQQRHRQQFPVRRDSNRQHVLRHLKRLDVRHGEFSPRRALPPARRRPRPPRQPAATPKTSPTYPRSRTRTRNHSEAKRRPHTAPPCASGAPSSAIPACTSTISRAPVLVPTTACLPPGANAAHNRTRRQWRKRARRRFHTLTPLCEHVRRVPSSGESATARTSARWPAAFERARFRGFGRVVVVGGGGEFPFLHRVVLEENGEDGANAWSATRLGREREPARLRFGSNDGDELELIGGDDAFALVVVPAPRAFAFAAALLRALLLAFCA